MILIDNYDSFTYNIVQYLQELGVTPKVFKNDETSVEELKAIDFESIILSPGPGNPCEPQWCGVCAEVIKEFYRTKKILGVCLGHQLLASFFGAEILKDPNPYHGKVSQIKILKESPLFKGIPDGFEATRYHSLYVKLPESPVKLSEAPMKLPESPVKLSEASVKLPKSPVKLPDESPLAAAAPVSASASLPIMPLAQTQDGMLMAFEHKDYPIYGVQFHPEAILTQYGHELFKNFLCI